MTPNDAVIVRAILAMSQSLDIQVVAEGVEIDAQWYYLMQSGCRNFQGYLFGRPMPSADLEMVRAGMAWWCRKYQAEQSAVDRVLYEDAENKAKSEHRGLWSHTGPVPPWEWRELKRHSH